MRLLSYSIDGGHGFGLLTADRAGVIDLGCRLDAEDLGALLAGEGLDAARPFLDEPADHAVADIVFERLLPSPGKIFCIGVNYGGRAQEYDDPADAAYPSVFVRFPPSFTGHEQPVIRPPESEQLDYEGEIVVVIGRHLTGRRAAASRWPRPVRTSPACRSATKARSVTGCGTQVQCHPGQELAEHRLDGAMAGADRRDPAIRRAADPDPRQRRAPPRRQPGDDEVLHRVPGPLPVDLLRAPARRCHLHRYADRRRRPLRSADLADARRRRRGLGARDRHTAKSGRCRVRRPDRHRPPEKQ